MPKTKRPKKEDTSDSDSGPEDRGPAQKKPAASSSLKKNEKGEIPFQLDKTKFVTVREFRSKVYVDLREFYEKDGEMLPGKKGIALSVDTYQKFKDLIPEIDKALSEF